MSASSDRLPPDGGTVGRERDGGGIRKLFGLQYLRALAACAVVCFHAASRAGYGNVIGEAGVDLFFVLSGFLMIVITSADTRPLAFLADRVRRIVPVYWIATTVMLGGALAGVFPNMELTIGYVIGSYAFVPVRVPAYGLIWPLLVQGWSLNFEMAFYVVFAALLWLAPRRSQVPLLTILFVVAVSAGFIVRPGGAILVSYSDPMMLEFVGGCWLGMMWKRHGALSERWAPVLLTIAILGYALAAWRDADSMRVVFYGIPALLLLAGTLALERRGGGIPAWRLPTLIGDASYSIYLWHTFAVSIVTRIALLTDIPGPLQMVVGIVSGIAGGVIAYWLLERPLLRLMKRRRTLHGVPIPAGV